MDIKERVQQYIDYKGININQLELSIGVSKSYWRKTKSISANIVADICRVYTDLNLEWLLRGTGDMLKSSSNIIGSNNNIRYNNKGNGNINSNIGVGNAINVALPESGTQKIIRPDGGVEIINGDSNREELDQLKKENDFLKSENSHFRSTMVLKDDLIASLKETIELLKHKQ